MSAANSPAGKHYAVPAAYTSIDGSLLVSSQFAWLHNLRTGEPVHIRLLGKQHPSEVRMLTEETAVVEHLAIMARDNHQFAKFSKISFDEAGDPGPTTYTSPGLLAPESRY
jgi:hypothetical protein